MSNDTIERYSEEQISDAISMPFRFADDSANELTYSQFIQIWKSIDEVLPDRDNRTTFTAEMYRCFDVRILIVRQESYVKYQIAIIPDGSYVIG